jgi:hypothetical protein
MQTKLRLLLTFTSHLKRAVNFVVAQSKTARPHPLGVALTPAPVTIACITRCDSSSVVSRPSYGGINFRCQPSSFGASKLIQGCSASLGGLSLDKIETITYNNYRGSSATKLWIHRMLGINSQGKSGANTKLNQFRNYLPIGLWKKQA